MENPRSHGTISCRVGKASLSNVGWSLRSLRILFLLSLPSIRDVEHEVDLPQMTLGSAPDSVAVAVQFDGRGVLDEGLTPDFGERFVE
jgi:hypothetical protein